MSRASTLRVLGAFCALLTAAVPVGGCNLITGASELEIDESDGAGGQSSGEGGASGGQTSGGPTSGATTGGQTSSGVTTTGGATTATSGATSTGSGAACGNAMCEAGEDCATCASDCGACGPMCGDAQCNGTETCSTCASDCGACSTCQGASDATTTLDAEEQAFLVLINQYRAQNGLGALAACTSLNRAAQGHSEDLRDQDYFSHTGLDGSSPWSRSCDACYALGCGPMTAMAENIAAGNSGAQGTFTQWQNSPGHNANMLGSSFTMIGIGRATGGGTYGSYWTNVFGGDTEPSCN